MNSEPPLPPERPRCSEDGCGKQASKRGMCRGCYDRRRRSGTLPTEWTSLRCTGKQREIRQHHRPPPSVAKCSVQRCPDLVFARLMCERHYGAWRRAHRRAMRILDRDAPGPRNPDRAEIEAMRLEQELDAKTEGESFGTPLAPWERHPIPWD